MCSLYEKIESLCKANGITITDMCRSSGASRGSLSDLKYGRKKTLKPETLVKIAEYFNVSTDYLLGKEKSPAIKPDDEAKNSNGERAAEIIDRLPPAKQEEALNYLRFLAQQDSEKK